MKIMPKFFGLTLLAAYLTGNAAGFVVDRIDPPHWWTRMKSTTLQLQVQGRDIRSAEPSVSYPGVRIDSVVRLDGSPDWQHIYLTISPGTKPGKMKITWKEGKRSVTRDYELRGRKTMRGARGLESSDVLYMIMPDRFASVNPVSAKKAGLKNEYTVDRSDPNVRHGGNLAGIAANIPYLDKLGVTAVWLNPVLENDMKGGSYHGYATTDYYRVDPRLGTNEEYAALIDTLHNHGIKTVMDMIFNHSGSGHPWLSALPSSDWVNNAEWLDGKGEYVETNHKLATTTDPYASSHDLKKATEGWFVPEMPDLNQHNPHLMKYLIQNSIWWIEEAGIDAIRMDTYPYADKDKMREWIREVTDEYPDFQIVGECWFAEPALCASWQSGSPLAKAAGDSGLEVVMDFPLMLKMRQMKPVAEQTSAYTGLSEIYNHFGLDFIYSDPNKVLRFLDNHDTDRFITELPDSLDRWKQAITLLLTTPGIPQLYYGTEVLMNGTREGGDGNVRKDMPGGFAGDTRTVFLPEGRTALENEAYDFISKLLQWRKGCVPIWKGTMRHFATDNGLYVYQRALPEERVTVVLNGRDETTEADMSRYSEIVEAGKELTDVLTGHKMVLVPEDGGKISFKPREILILTDKTETRK